MRHGRKRPSRRSWPRLGSAVNKTTAIKRVLDWKPDASGREVHRFFSGVTREGLVTHCWRYGPKLSRAKAGPKKSLPRARAKRARRG